MSRNSGHWAQFLQPFLGLVLGLPKHGCQKTSLLPPSQGLHWPGILIHRLLKNCGYHISNGELSTARFSECRDKFSFDIKESQIWLQQVTTIKWGTCLAFWGHKDQSDTDSSENQPEYVFQGSALVNEKNCVYDTEIMK